MDTSGLDRLDSFPYRRKVADVMSSPPVTASPDISLIEAAQLMAGHGVGSLLAVDPAGRPVGIVTERDVLRALAREGEGAAAIRFGDVMSAPVATVRADALLHVAIARMARLGIRHLAVTAADGTLAGVVAAGALLRLRANAALVLGDEVEAAADAQALGKALARLPPLAQGLLNDEVSGRGVARVISAVLRDTVARAAELAASEMAAAGRGEAPAAFAVLVLGSAGRGESLLAPDQDNALVHAGDDGVDAWFADFGARLTRILDEAGMPYCKGKVMVSEPAWRASLAGWQKRVDGWIARSKPEDLLNVDIFFDAVPVWGDATLAARLRDYAVKAASRAYPFLKLLHANVSGMGSAIGPFGILRSDGGRVDLKRFGLLPVTAGARLLALAAGFGGTATPRRLAEARARGKLAAADAVALDEAHETLMRLVLEQQLADIAAGQAAGNLVDLARLDRVARGRLKSAFRVIDRVCATVGDSLLAR
jgi:CBS domain-containing protein